MSVQRGDSNARRSSLQQAIDFSSQATPTYIFEDTTDRSYRDIVELFEESGWRKVPHRKRSKDEQKRRENNRYIQGHLIY